MNRSLLSSTTALALFIIAVLVLAFVLASPRKARAFNNNNGRNLPFCDTTMTPSWDPCGIYYEWIGRRWFVPGTGCTKSSRTFYLKKARQEQLTNAYQATLDRLMQGFNRHQAAKHSHQSSAIEVTCEDMQKAYAFNSDFLEFYAFPTNVTMDLGASDPEFTAPQRWSIPAGLEFTAIERKILDPKTTPYSQLAPEATHCLYVKSPNRGMDMYQYYLLDEDGLWFEGNQVEELNFSDYSEDGIMTLPLDIDTDYYSGYGEEDDWTIDGDTTWYDDSSFCVDAWYYWSEGYGVLETPDDGPVEVIKIAYQWIWSEWQVDEESEDGKDILTDFENGTEVYFYSKYGHQLMISLDSLGVETAGLVKPNVVYYQKVHKPETSVAQNLWTTAPELTFYPNPTQGTVHFNTPSTFEVIDLLGRRVFSQENTMQANLSHLPRGTYFIRPQQGMTQKITIQK